AGLSKKNAAAIAPMTIPAPTLFQNEAANLTRSLRCSVERLSKCSSSRMSVLLKYAVPVCRLEQLLPNAVHNYRELARDGNSGLSVLVVWRAGVSTMGGALHGRRGRAPKTPTLLDVLWVRGRLKLQNQERSLPRVLDSSLRVTASPTRVCIVGGGIMSKRNLVIEEGSVEALARLQKQDEEFCRRLRTAIETGRECCPTTVFAEPSKKQ